jgi:hypothetical protein
MANSAFMESWQHLRKDTKMDGRCISQNELAKRWQVSESTLERWRYEGIGPVFLKLRGKVPYRDSDILAFEAQALQASTRQRSFTDPGNASDVV